MKANSRNWLSFPKRSSSELNRSPKQHKPGHTRIKSENFVSLPISKENLLRMKMNIQRLRAFEKGKEESDQKRTAIGGKFLDKQKEFNSKPSKPSQYMSKMPRKSFSTRNTKPVNLGRVAAVVPVKGSRTI